MNENGEYGHHAEGDGYKKPGDLSGDLKNMFQNMTGHGASHGEHGSHGDHGGGHGESRGSATQISEKRFQHSPNFFTNTSKGTTREFAYKLMAKEIPELGMSVDEEARISNGDVDPDSIGVNMKRTPDNILFVRKMMNDPLLKFIDSPVGSAVGELLEERGYLKSGMSSRIMKRYQEKMITKGVVQPLFPDDLEGTTAATDEEVEAIVRQTILQNFADFNQQIKKSS